MNRCSLPFQETVDTFPCLINGNISRTEEGKSLFYPLKVRKNGETGFPLVFGLQGLYEFCGMESVGQIRRNANPEMVVTASVEKVGIHGLDLFSV